MPRRTLTQRTKEAKPSPNTGGKWRTVLNRMVALAGSSDLGTMSEVVLQGWIDSRLPNLEDSTICKVLLAAAKRISRYAKGKKQITVDPTCALPVVSGKRYETKMRS